MPEEISAVTADQLYKRLEEIMDKAIQDAIDGTLARVAKDNQKQTREIIKAINENNKKLIDTMNNNYRRSNLGTTPR